MRLLNTDNLEVREFGNEEVPQYAILSHTWEEEEATLQDMMGTCAVNKKGYMKIKRCCSVARTNGFKYVWIDTCCIDRTSSAELSEAINSMYLWYQEAGICYAYLADVPSKAIFSSSRWFTRGWTLQELIAPSTVIFLDMEWKELGTKASLRQDISDCTDIPISILSGDDDLEEFSIAQRMSWAAKRKTSRIEDRAYCLLGIFGIHMPLIYGEREAAFTRLQEEIMRISDDHSLFAWKSSDNRGGLLSTSPAAFIGSNNIVQSNPLGSSINPLTISSRGIYLELHLIGIGPRRLGLAVLHCKEKGEDSPIAIYVRDLFLEMNHFERVWSEELERLDLRKFRLSQYGVRRIWIRKGRIIRTRKPEDPEKCDNVSPDIYTVDTLASLVDSGEQTALLWAARKGLEDIVWLLLTRSDTNVNSRERDGRTALSHAIEGGHEGIVKMLLARSDIAINGGDIYDEMPLPLASRVGNEAIIKLLLEADKVDVESKNSFGGTLLSWAAENGHEVMVKVLLETGKVDVNSEDRGGRTPLILAAKGGHETTVERLLEAGKVDSDPRDKYGWTPLLWAATNGHEVTVKLLLKTGKVNVNSKGGDSQTPLLLAVRGGHEAVVKLLLETGKADVDMGARSGWTPLLLAAQNGYESIVKLLLETGKAGVDKKAISGRTPLSLAAGNGYESIVKLLLKTGKASVNSEGEGGRTPLSWAAQYGHEAVVKLLLEMGNANVDSKDANGRTPLSWAAEHGHEAVVKLLLEMGDADVHSEDARGRTPLSWATKNKHKAIVKLLRRRR